MQRDDRENSGKGVDAMKTFVAAATALLLTTCALAQNEPGKKWRESRVKVPEVTANVTVEPSDAKPGDTVKYKVSVKVDQPWHIYAWADKQPAEGPRATQFNFYETGGLTPSKEWTASDSPQLKKEPAFPNLDVVAFHEKSIAWTTTLTVPKDAKAGKATLKGQMLFQICNEGSCKPPTTVALPDATVNITK
jgi:thiol:disulfide interchange protein DsbD